jgi:2-desacetyl-2-hydroxyethyl bacteriochlorophyllide A dehydrogenase
MRAVCFEGVESVGLREIPDPRIESAADAIVDVELAGLCGSDLHVYHGRETGMDVGTAMGHEMVGRVSAIGSAVTKFRIGDRVTAPFSTCCGECYFCQRGLTSRCQKGELFGWRQSGRGLHGCQAERVRVPYADATLVRLPDSLSSPLGILLCDNLSTAFFCAELAEVAAAETCAIVGCGPVGLLGVFAARRSGSSKIFAVDQVEHRLGIAEQLGAIPVSPKHAISAVHKETNGRGADSVMELVGLPEAQSMAFELLRPGGTMGVIGCHCAAQFAFSPVQAYDKNLSYRTGRCPARFWMERLLPVASEFDAIAKTIVTHTFRFADCAEAYETFARRRDRCLKAVLVTG